MQKLYPYFCSVFRFFRNLFMFKGYSQTYIFANCTLDQLIQVHKIFSENSFDAVMHFAAVAYVGESTLDPLK